MTDQPATPRRGRRARKLSPEEQAALEKRATRELSAVPGIRGAVPAPGADAPVPSLRRFGRHARIIELEDPTPEPVTFTELPAVTDGDHAEGEPGQEEQQATADSGLTFTLPGEAHEADDAPHTHTSPIDLPAGFAEEDGEDENLADRARDSRDDAADDSADQSDVDRPGSDEPEAQHSSDGIDVWAAPAQTSPVTEEPEHSQAPVAAHPAPSAPTATATATAVVPEPIRRDVDGVELGEMSVTEAPDPKPAPRFEGQVLHRPERAGGRSLVWLVWLVIAIAIVALVVLLVTGVIGGGTNALGALSDLVGENTAPSAHNLPATTALLEETAA